MGGKGYAELTRGIWELVLWDPRVVVRELNVPFPSEARRRAPLGPGLVIVTGPDLRRVVLAVPDVASWAARTVLELPGTNADRFRIRDRSLPPEGTAHFLITQSYEAAQALAADLEGNAEISF
ncbi:MAG: hypothetical protein Kow00109_09320 [Acidobacteriota bacterium]